MSIGEIGAYFDERAKTWDAMMEPSGAKHIAIAQLAYVRESSRVLDIGCGTGIMVPAYLQMGASRIVGLDLSQNMIDNARKNFADVSTSTLSFLCEDVLMFDESDCFDCVVMYNCYPHLMNKEALVKKVADLLVPGGRFLVAHGMGRTQMNHHHAAVPPSVTSTLESAQQESERWRTAFTVDEIADTPFLYFFGGQKR